MSYVADKIRTHTASKSRTSRSSRSSRPARPAKRQDSTALQRKAQLAHTRKCEYCDKAKAVGVIDSSLGSKSQRFGPASDAAEQDGQFCCAACFKSEFTSDPDMKWRLIRPAPAARRNPNVVAKAINEKKTKIITTAAGIPFGGVIESGEGIESIAWDRTSLRRHVKVVPQSQEGIWYTYLAIKAMADGDLEFGFDDAGLQKAAANLIKQLDKVRDLWDT